MRPLSSEARHLLAKTRHTDDPTSADESRIKMALARRLSMGTTAALVGVGTAKAAAGATALAVAGKSAAVATAAIVVAFAIGQAQVTHRADSVHPTPAAASAARGQHWPKGEGKPIETIAVQPAQGSGPVAVTSRLATEPRSLKPIATTRTDATPFRRPSTASFDPLPDNSESSVGQATDSHSVQASVSGSTAHLSNGSVLVTQPDVKSNLPAETAALREAQRVMRAGDPARAIALINAQDAAYPTGALGQERAAARIYALCALGHNGQARLEAEQFVGHFPRSPMLSQVRTACDGR